MIRWYDQYSYVFDFICPKEELSVTVATIPPSCCVTDVTLDPLRSPNFPRGLKLAPAHTQVLALLSLPYGRWEASTLMYPHSTHCVMTKVYSYVVCKLFFPSSSWRRSRSRCSVTYIELSGHFPRLRLGRTSGKQVQQWPPWKCN